MPDLGSYAMSVLASYAVTLTLLVIIVAFSVWRFRRVRAALAAIERTQSRHD
ncbi:MAG: heme exporter protein CcmD [Pseudomonadota bacterium]